MTTYLLTGDAVIAPTIVTALSTGRPVATIVHPILGRDAPDVTVRPAGLRTGSLELGFSGEDAETASADAERLLAAGVATIVTDERATLAFSFVAQGTVTRDLEPVTRDAWLVRLDFQEVAA